MNERQAVYYGQVELIPGIVCDGYVLDDDTAVMGIIGTAELLSLHYKVLQNIATKCLQKSLEPFIDKGLNSATQTVKVIAQNSHHKGREIKVYDIFFIESLIRAYAFAL